MVFERAVEVVLKHEGGYVWHPRDPGGETNFGISKRAYPHLNIKELTREQAAEIYRKDYWEKCKIETLPEPLRLMVFDTAVNMGPQRAIGLLQAVVGATVDGSLGPETLALVERFDALVVLHRYTLRRLDAYTNLATFKTFGIGWTRRLIDVSMRSVSSVEVTRG